MKTIRISDAVWNFIVQRGKFGETPDDVLRRVLKIDQGDARSIKIRHRISNRIMRPGIVGTELVVGFQDGPSNKWSLPSRSDKNAIKELIDKATDFIKKNDGTDGQACAMRKALNNEGYYITKKR